MAECSAGENLGYSKKNWVVLSLDHVPSSIGQTLLEGPLCEDMGKQPSQPRFKLTPQVVCFQVKTRGVKGSF